MRSTVLQVTTVLSLFLLSSATAKRFAGNQSSVHIGGSGVLSVPVHRRHTAPGDPGAKKRQVSTGLLNPLYGLSYYVNGKWSLANSPHAVLHLD
jgi:hypothetical protein